MDARRFIELRTLVGRIAHKYAALESVPLDFGTGEPINPSEMHVLEIVGDGAAATSIEAARRLGITKGAVFQTVSKLEAAGYLGREPSPESAKEKLLELTPKGRAAYRGHAELHSRIDSGFKRKLDRMPAVELEAAERVLRILEEHLDEWAAKLDGR